MIPKKYSCALVKIPVQLRVSVTISVPKMVQCIPHVDAIVSYHRVGYRTAYSAYLMSSAYVLYFCPDS